MNKKIILTESQYEKLKFFILESTFDKMSRTVIKKGDFVQIETKQNVLNFEVIDSYGGQIYMKNIDDGTEYFDKLVFISPSSFINNQLELKVANDSQKDEKPRNPKNWQRINIKNVNRIDAYRDDELIDSAEEIDNKEEKPSDKEPEPETEKKDKKLLSLGLDAYNEIINDPNLKKAFYKKPNFWALFMAELKGKKAPGSGIVPTLQLLDDYEKTKLVGKFNVGKTIKFTVNKLIEINYGASETKKFMIGPEYIATVNKNKKDGKWVFENKTDDFKVLVLKETDEQDTFECKLIKYVVVGDEYKEYSSDVVNIVIAKDSEGYNPNESGKIK